MNDMFRASVILVLFLCLMISSIVTIGQPNSNDLDIKLKLNNKVIKDSNFQIGIQLNRNKSNIGSISTAVGLLYEFSIVAYYDNRVHTLYTMNDGSTTYFADSYTANQPSLSNRIIDSVALVRVGELGLRINNYTTTPLMVKIKNNSIHTVGDLLKRLIKAGYLLDESVNIQDIQILIIGEGNTYNEILESAFANSDESKHIDKLHDKNLYFICDGSENYYGVFFKSGDDDKNNNYDTIFNLIVNKKEYQCLPIKAVDQNIVPLSGSQSKKQNNNKGNNSNKEANKTSDPESLEEAFQRKNFIPFKLHFTKGTEYDDKLNVPADTIYWFPPNVSHFTYTLPKDKSEIWEITMGPEVDIYKESARNGFDIKLNRRVIKKNAYIRNDNHISEPPSKYEILISDMQPLHKKPPPKLKKLSVNKNDGFSKVNLIKPFKVLETDSPIIVKIFKPFGFTINNVGKLSEFNNWEKEDIKIDFTRVDSITLNWVYLNPLQVYYFDLSDTRDRQSTIDILTNKIDINDTIKNAFLIYVSNQKSPVYISDPDELNSAIGMLRTIDPLPPNIEFDKTQLQELIKYNRRPIRYHFFISESTFTSTKLIASFLLELYGYAVKGINEDKIELIMKKINSERRNATVDIYIHNIDDYGLEKNLKDVNYINW